MINPLGIITTAVIYKIVETFKHYPILKSLPPILVSGIAIIFFLNFFNIDYSVYQESVLYLTLLLIPATISLGYPLYKNMTINEVINRLNNPTYRDDDSKIVKEWYNKFYKSFDKQTFLNTIKS